MINFPLFLWRSILSGKRLLEKGLRWRVGDESRIRDFEDPWISQNTHFKPMSRLCFMQDRLVVSDLLDNRQWNQSLIDVLFEESDITTIITTPICPIGGHDCLTRHFTQSRRFTVGSTYSLALRLHPINLMSSSSSTGKSGWSYI